MTGKDRSPKADRNEGRIEGIPGRNLLSFERRVLEHGWTYEEGGEEICSESGNFPRSPRGEGSPLFYYDPPPTLLPSTNSRMCRIWQAPKRWDVGLSFRVSQSVRQSMISKSVGRAVSDDSLSLMVASNFNVK